MPETLYMWQDYVPIAIYIYVLAHCSFFINEKPDVLYADETLEVFVLRASVLGLISSMRLDNGKNIQSAKSDWSVLDIELKACFLPQPPTPHNL